MKLSTWHKVSDYYDIKINIVHICSNLFHFQFTDVEHKKQNIFQRALAGDKNHQSNSNKMKVRHITKVPFF